MKKLLLITLCYFIFDSIAISQNFVDIKTISSQGESVASAVNLNGSFVFLHQETPELLKLFKSDGTLKGTSEIYQFNGMYRTTDYILGDYNFTNNGLYYFVVEDDKGKELWRTDGTKKGTFIVKDIAQGKASDGTPFSSSPHFFCKNNDKILFAASQSGYKNENSCNRTWRSKIFETDGTNEGTKIIVDNLCSPPSNMIKVGNTYIAYFNDGWLYSGSKKGLYRLSNNQFELIKGDYTYLSSSPLYAVINPNCCLFEAEYNNSNNRMICLWKTDGTSGGTTLLSSINNQTNKTQINYSPSYTIANNTLYFVVNHFSSTDYNAKIDYVELWKSDGTISGTVKIKDFKPKGNMLFNLSNLKTFNNKVIFVWDDQNKVELWISDGTETGTYKLKDTQSNYNISLAATDKYLYFTQGSSIWVTDGTVNGTHQCKNFVPNVNDYISNLTNVNNTIFFTLSTYSHYRHLYKITSDK